MPHTPGPWIVTPELGCKDIGPVDLEDDDGIYAIAGTYGISPEADDRDNAALIAAAPELLAHCKELVELMDDIVGGLYVPDSFTTQPARIEIAKAEGTQ